MNFLSSSAACVSTLGSQGVRWFWACELWQPVKRGGREGNSEWRKEEVRGEGKGKRRIMKRNVRGGAPLVCQPCTVCVCVWCMSVCESLNTLPWVSESDMRSCFSSQSQTALKLTLLLSLTLSLSDFLLSLLFSPELLEQLQWHTSSKWCKITTFSMLELYFTPSWYQNEPWESVSYSLKILFCEFCLHLSTVVSQLGLIYGNTLTWPGKNWASFLL